MTKQDYTVTRNDIEWVAGQRVQHDESGKPLPVSLTDAQAEPELMRGLIELAKPAEAAKTLKLSKPAQGEG